MRNHRSTAGSPGHSHKPDTDSNYEGSLRFSILSIPIVLVCRVSVLSGIWLEERFGRPVGIVGAERICLGIIHANNAVRIDLGRETGRLRILEESGCLRCIVLSRCGCEIGTVSTEMVEERLCATPGGPFGDESQLEPLRQGLFLVTSWEDYRGIVRVFDETVIRGARVDRWPEVLVARVQRTVLLIVTALLRSAAVRIVGHRRGTG